MHKLTTHVGTIGRTLPAEPRPESSIQKKAADRLATGAAQAPFDAHDEGLDVGRGDPANQTSFSDPDDALKKRGSTVQARFCRLGHLLDPEPHAPRGSTWFRIRWSNGGTAIVRSIEGAEALVDTLEGASDARRHCRRWWTEAE